MHEIKQYLIDLTIITVALFTKLYASIMGFTFGIDALDILGKCLYVLVMLITGFTSIYRFVKETKTNRAKSKEAEGEKQK